MSQFQAAVPAATQIGKEIYSHTLGRLQDTPYTIPQQVPPLPSSLTRRRLALPLVRANFLYVIYRF